MDKSEKQYEKKSSLKKRIKELEDKREKIIKENKDLTDKIKHVTENLENKHAALREAFQESFNFIKNPLVINHQIYQELISFENNLTKKGIPKSVGESFFLELTKYKECLCGNEMTNNMRENIKKNKHMFLEMFINCLALEKNPNRKSNLWNQPSHINTHFKYLYRNFFAPF